MTGPTLAEMVERLRTCALVAPLPVVTEALMEIDRKGRDIFDAAADAVEKELANIGPDARAIRAYLVSGTAQITADELARALDLPVSRVREVIRRAGITHRWLV